MRFVPLALLVTASLLLALPAAAQFEGLRVEISLSEREAYVFVDDEIVRTEPVAVGKPGHETPTGEWHIYQIDWNPDWTPPDSEWSEDEDFTEPGDSDNPMGRVRMIFDPPYSIHGTDANDSLGKAASHGSIRMSNEAIKEVARLVMEHADERRDEAWFEEVLSTPDEMVEVMLSEPVPIYVME